MAALTADRKTARRDPETSERHGVAASTTIYAGSIVAVNASGYAVPASASKALKVVGIAESKAVGTSTAGATKIAVKRDVGVFGNSSLTDALTIADIGHHCYVVDDQTVARTPGTSYQRPLAGRVVDVTTEGVWVEVAAPAETYQIVRSYGPADFNAAALTEVVAFGTPSPGSQLLGVDVFVGTAFSGAGVTDAKVAIGTAGDDDVILASADVDAATAGRASTFTVGIGSRGVYGELLNVKLTTTGANVSLIDAGAITVVATFIQG